MKSPESRHPNTLERTQNLNEIFQELSATKLENGGRGGTRKRPANPSEQLGPPLLIVGVAAPALLH